MGLFGPSWAEFNHERELRRAVERALKQTDTKLDRALDAHERAVRHMIALDLIAGRRIRVGSLHLPMGRGLNIDQMIREERDRLELRGHQLPERYRSRP